MKKAICADCGKEKTIKAKGLCHACYRRSLNRKSRPVVVVDFHGHEGLLEELKQRAEQEFRPLEWQIMKILKGYVAAPHREVA